MLAWVLRDFNPDDFFQTLAEANYYFLIVLAISIIFEQLIRAFKWSLILSPFVHIILIKYEGTTTFALLFVFSFDFKTVSKGSIITCKTLRNRSDAEIVWIERQS